MEGDRRDAEHRPAIVDRRHARRSRARGRAEPEALRGGRRGLRDDGPQLRIAQPNELFRRRQRSGRGEPHDAHARLRGQYAIWPADTYPGPERTEALPTGTDVETEGRLLLADVVAGIDHLALDGDSRSAVSPQPDRSSVSLRTKIRLLRR